jgi:methionine-rich copper-binding protein CopC
LQYYGLDFLHAIFHIIILYSSFTLVSVFAYFDVVEEHPEKTPVMKFWPNDFEMGFPYVALKGIIL